MGRENQVTHKTSEDVAELKFLDPARLRLFRTKGGSLRLTIANECSYLKVSVTRAFPLSGPRHYIGLRDGTDNEIGIIRDIRKLDSASRELVEEELKKRYFMPVIRRIKSIREEFGLSYWHVETDKGARQFIVRNPRDNLIAIGLRRVMVLDVDGNRFEIPDYTRLDPRSFAFVNRVL